MEPFYEATEQGGINECHRSKKAYSELLANTPGSRLNLTDFVACSRATTSNIINATQWDEGSAQHMALQGADVATISIGGNDVSFSLTIIRCIIEATGAGPARDYDDTLDAPECLDRDIETIAWHNIEKLMERNRWGKPENELAGKRE